MTDVKSEWIDELSDWGFLFEHTNPVYLEILPRIPGYSNRMRQIAARYERMEKMLTMISVMGQAGEPKTKGLWWNGFNCAEQAREALKNE